MTKEQRAMNNEQRARDKNLPIYSFSVDMFTVHCLLFISKSEICL